MASLILAVIISLIPPSGVHPPQVEPPARVSVESLLAAYHGPAVCRTVDNFAAAYKAPRREETVRAILTQAAIWRVDPLLVAAVVAVESCFRPWAVSRCGARGLMQLLPSTARGLGVRDIHDVGDNIRGGVRQLAYLSSRFGRREHVLAAYNAGPARARGPWPEETRHYVPRVLQLYAMLRATASRMTQDELYPRGTYVYPPAPSLVKNPPPRGCVAVQKPEPGRRVYVVCRGDTLWRIALRFGTTVEELARRNHIANPDIIRAGQRLEV